MVNPLIFKGRFWNGKAVWELRESPTDILIMLSLLTKANNLQLKQNQNLCGLLQGHFGAPKECFKILQQVN